MAGPFSYRLAQEIGLVFKRHGVKYLFIGKSGAMILGFPDTTQDVDLFVEKSQENCRALIGALTELGFPLGEQPQAEILRGKDFIQLREGPYDLDLVFAPDGIEDFAQAVGRSINVDGLQVCHIDDIVRSKEAAGRVKDMESLPRLKAFRDWWLQQKR